MSFLPVLKRFEHPDEVREFENGRIEIAHIGGLAIGRATYEPSTFRQFHTIAGSLGASSMCRCICSAPTSTHKRNND
jgi:hypothetical protein